MSQVFELPSHIIRRESLTEQTARAIREAVLVGTYTPGQKLRETELAARFGVSNSVIREALHVLQGEGIVTTKPYCGRSVFSLQPQEALELLAVRASLESYAAYLAARKMNPESERHIRAAAARMISGPPSSYSEWVDREHGFHQTVWAASQNDWLVRQLSQVFLPMFAVSIMALAKKDFDTANVWQIASGWEKDGNPRGHQLLARTIIEGDAPRARATMALHILPEMDDVRRDLFQV